MISDESKHGIDREQWYLMGYNHDIRGYDLISRDGFPPRLLARYLLEPRPAIAHRTYDMRIRIAAANKLARAGIQPTYKLPRNRTYQSRPPPR